MTDALIALQSPPDLEPREGHLGAFRGTVPSIPAYRPKSKSSTDLRRRDRRALAEAVVARAAFLPPDERTLVLAVFARGQTACDVARLAGRPARPLRRRLKRLVARVLTPEFAFVAVHRERWPVTMQKVATACVLHGQPLRRAAATTGLTYHTVRRQRHAVLAMAEAARAMGPRGIFGRRARAKACPGAGGMFDGDVRRDVERGDGGDA